MSVRVKKPGIYQILNVENGKSYVGHSTHVVQRWGQHRGELKKQKHHNSHLQASWNKYGEGAFVYRILELIESTDREFLEQREDYWINFYNTIEKGYNQQSSKNGTFSEKWQKQERVRKETKYNENYYIDHKKLQHLSLEHRQIVSSFILNLKRDYKVQVKILTQYIKVDLICKKTNLKHTEYLNLTTFKISNHIEVKPNKIYQIEPETSNILKIFNSPQEILNTYPQVKRSQLERILYLKSGHRSTQGLVFIPESQYEEQVVYSVKGSSRIGHTSGKIYTSMDTIIKEFGISKNQLHNVLYQTGKPTEKVPFFFLTPELEFSKS